METEEQFFTCPYCWENISIVLDLSAESQRFVEDCEVCCHPIQFEYTAEDGVLTSFQVSRLN